MRALVIRHDHASSPGPIGSRLAEHGYDLDERTVVPAERHHDPAVDFTFPAPYAYDLILILGAPWSIYDKTATGPWIEGELDLLRRAHATDIPILGICFGGQALATALGGTVERAPRPEIGWMTIEPEAADSVPEGPWFQWHFDRFTVPPGAVELARSAVGPQAFRAGRALGVQFHPEITEETLRQWLVLGGRTQAEQHGVAPDRLIADTRASREDSRQRAYDLVDRFLRRVAHASAPGML
ncbi:type 1 glutamine amidotransferase [Streptomyces sp. TRM68367]|uniref:type 1 glutamine amidotransferase n=1 Tax=Streptomyces sp. TRM68367 TaxID=2758415 RepID=UPI00165A3558|nr:type 1 glutamine amidotransferase [Streptomyces sp. TRM68367]MBC9724756.1 type 1 glutamine amidotransferase [Streptomyces sp. TRM68367]